MPNVVNQDREARDKKNENRSAKSAILNVSSGESRCIMKEEEEERNPNPKVTPKNVPHVPACLPGQTRRAAAAKRYKLFSALRDECPLLDINSEPAEQ